MSFIDEQWKDILEQNPFTESGVFTTYLGDTFTVSGMYYSGSYENGSNASYGAKRWERGDYFQVSALSLPSTVVDPVKDLRNAQISITGRGIFRVHQVKGANSGMLTLEIQPREYLDA